MSIKHILICLLLPLAIGNQAECQSPSTVNEVLRMRAELLPNNGMTVYGDDLLCNRSLYHFYNGNNFTAVWTPTMAKSLLENIKAVSRDGLNPADYHKAAIERALQDGRVSNYEKAGFELLLSDAFILLSSHLISGKVDPKSFDAQWKINRREGKPLVLLQKASDTDQITQVLEQTRPKYKAYDRLRTKLAAYRTIAYDGGWQKIPDGPTLKPGVQDDRIAMLRERLRYSGDIPAYQPEDVTLFDSILEVGIKRFQKRHGLTADGAVGATTLAALNVPVETRINDIMINLERSRWLPDVLGEWYVMVNLPAFELEIVKNGNVEMEMDVAVGKPYRETPVFSSVMTYLVLNPYWTVPPTILSQDMIPAQAKNPNHLKNLNIKVLAPDGQEVDPSSINWSAGMKNFNYTLRQEPGPNNALGQVKFIFPNEFNVYMHDTNHPEVFGKSDRALSSGCIRLSKPLDMTSYFLQYHSPPINSEKLQELLSMGNNKTIMLKQPVQVHLQYWTAFVDENGDLNFRKDVYNRNSKVLNAMMEKPNAL